VAQVLLGRVRCNALKVPGAGLKSFVGRAQSLRLAVPETAFRLRSLYDAIPPRRPSMGPSVRQCRSRSFSSRSRSLAFVSQLRSKDLYGSRYVRLSHPAVSDLQFWRDLPKHLHPPPYMAVPSQPQYHYPYRLFSQHLWRYVGTAGPLEAGSEGLYEMSGFWEN
jgi:hypothetical protein